jgi:predicted ATPase
VSLIGEAGQGKSRLLSEFLARLPGESDRTRITQRRVSCSAMQARTYGVVAGFVYDAYDITADDAIEVARAKLVSGVRALGADSEQISLLEPMLGYILGREAIASEKIQPERLRRQIFCAMVALIEQRLQAGPLVLAVEDLQWADAASVELLCHLVDRVPERSLLVVFT